MLAREKLSSAVGISLQMVNLLIAQVVRAPLALLGPQDVLIKPELFPIGNP